MSVIRSATLETDYLPSLCEANGCTADPAPGTRFCRFHLRSRSLQAEQHRHMQRKAFSFRVKRVAPLLGTKLYAIGIAESPVIKFGISHDPRSRMGDLQVSQPLTLHMVGFVGCDRQLERDVHLYCAEHRVRGEWFRIEGRAKAIVQLIVAGDPLSIYSLVGRDPPTAIF